MSSDETWHLVEARRDGDEQRGSALFRIRDLPPEPALSKIFVVELPYKTSEMSTLPDATAYRRLSQFEEQWLRPACSTLGWEFVAAKIEDGSTFLYCYGAGEPHALLEKLAPFDGSLAFYDEEDPEWQEYAAIKELLDEAESLKQQQPTDLEAEVVATPHSTRKRAATVIEPLKKHTQPIRKPGKKDQTVVTNAAPARKIQAPADGAMTPAEREHEAELFDKSGAPRLSSKAGSLRRPTKKAAKAKSSAKAGATKRPATSAVKKPAAKKPAAKKTAAKKSAPKNSSAKKSAAKKSAAKKKR